MSELISVDFKAGLVTKRVDLDKPEVIPDWSAAKDPDFKAFVEGIAYAVEAMHKAGGTWRRMIVVVQDDQIEEKACYTLWDQSVLDDKEVMRILETSKDRVSASVEAKDDRPS